MISPPTGRRVKPVTLPELSQEAELGARGVRIVDAIVSDVLGSIFRPKERADLGIDGEIETVVLDNDGRKRGTGRIIAVQIKCGTSFFSEEHADYYVFRGELKHLHYWLGFSVPVLIIICHPITAEAFWVEVKPSQVQRTEKGWKIAIPKSQHLASASRELKAVARRSYLQANIELAAKVWFFEMNGKKVDFAGDFGIPRDFYGFDHLCNVGEDHLLVAWIVARYGRFEAEDLQGVLERSSVNKAYADRLFIGLIAEHPDAFHFTKRWNETFEPAIETRVVHLLYNRSTSQIGRLDENGEVELEYHKGQVVYTEASSSFVGYESPVKWYD